MTATKVKTRKQIEAINVYSPGKPAEELTREYGITDVIKMASNENPLGCSSLAKQAMANEMEHSNLYPEATAPALAEKLANKLSVNKDRILVGSGSDEIIRILTRTYITENDEVIMADVTFPRYQTNVLIEGGTPVKVPLVDGAHDLDRMLKALTEKTKMIFVCNPNNPTGTIVGKDQLLSFIEQVPPHVLVVVDEAYYEYVTSCDYLETLPLLDQYSNLIVLRTFSKLYGLAALRVGYGLMDPSIVAELMKVKEPFNVNRIAQVAAMASLDDEPFLQSCKQKNEQGRVFLEQSFAQMGLTYFPSQANFVMADLGQPGDLIYQELLKYGIIVRPGNLLGYPATLRVTIGNEKQNQSFIDALQSVL